MAGEGAREAGLPAVLQAQAREVVEELGALALPAAVASSLPKVFACSEFVARTCQRWPQMLEDLAATGELTSASAPDALRARLQGQLADVPDADELGTRLRRFRRREMVRIAWRDIAGWAELEEVLTDLSRLADACLDEALTPLYRWQSKSWGTPRDSTGRAQQLVVLGMGKLGGEELNFSSDIDLIFAYPESGETDGPRPRSNEEFFTAVGRKLIAALDAPTAEGQVFRVDMRLRPYGESGPLAMSFDAVENYYQNQGREWERYALIKARVVAGDHVRGKELLARLRPFVYRRYLDYGALESLRELKTMIMREVSRRGLQENIKLGRGGIREVEFIGQAFQLIRGGREPALQERRILPVLRYLKGAGQLPAHAADKLIGAYCFLRKAENRLQAMHDRQTHELPQDPLDRARLACAMDLLDWGSFLRTLESHRHTVQDQFDQVFVAPQAEAGESEPDEHEIAAVWLSDLNEAEACELLDETGFAEPKDAYQRLIGLREGPSCRSLSANGRRRLDRLMPLLMAAAAGADHPDETLARLLQIIEAIVRRTAYLALLVEHPMALSQLVRLAAASPWIARFLTRHPLLLDELLDPRTLYAPLGGPQLVEDVDSRLQGLGEGDLEQQMEVLRQFKQTNYLRVAAADVSGAVPLMVVSDYLTEIAEVTLRAVLTLAYREISARYGRPWCVDAGTGREPGFAIVAYGKLGGIELGYGSDLDLVFLHDSRGEEQQTRGAKVADNQLFFARLAQRMIHILSTPTPGGVLYEVDTRLRPSGKSGLLTTSLDSFAQYQRTSAWTWEHQALVRARVVAGDPALAAGFAAVRREVLSRPREEAALRREVRDMRERMRGQLGAKGGSGFDLKQDRGGIADIEFMVQYGVLAKAQHHSGLLQYTDNIRLLEGLSQTGWLTADEAALLADAYRTYRSCVHKRTLQEQPARVDAPAFAEFREPVAALWQRLMEQ
jgi:[glutamine synthetase] adenylyltransferase / [glutamine synthetase]-adenylyl-L-tyrosine phosphorylase